jgi:hypothetical protein
MKEKHQKQLKKCIIKAPKIVLFLLLSFCLSGLAIMINCKKKKSCRCRPKSVGFNELHLSHHPHTFFSMFYSPSSLHAMFIDFFPVPFVHLFCCIDSKYMKCSFRNGFFLVFIAFLWLDVSRVTNSSSSLSKHTHLIFFS